MKASVLILTHNEAANLPACLDALSWCDDIVVIDSGSTDETVAVARHHGARVLVRSFDDFAGQRNFGLEQGDFRHEWVVHLDADEVVTPAFVRHLEQLRAQPGIDGYRVPSKLMLFGGWLRYAGMYPTYQVRLGHRDRLRFRQVGHGQREDLPADRIGVFHEPYLHYSFSHGMKRWLEKHVRYAQDEADLILSRRAGAGGPRISMFADNATERRRAAKAMAGKLPLALRPGLRFFYVYFVRQGFRDGRSGFAYALMMSIYEGMIAVLAYEKLFQERRGASKISSVGAQAAPPGK
ncbi:glycosyltransferase family 2 protein [Labrys monachus]|uniref:Glycosyltransferase involved in cell wall biosynthesis n=1 Tax=Labrys monachus TaxID=217067 RepID=A0ABU0FJI8_9HYPH|nr:glycosyltransferase family 2 protein [Labrys monachus]MDQ0394779.1 glycosyltransferase involved in cell wall biosynthesis [Labrys monachus]